MSSAADRLEDLCEVCGRHERVRGTTVRAGDVDLPVYECPVIPPGALYVVPEGGLSFLGWLEPIEAAVRAEDWASLPVIRPDEVLRLTITRPD